MGRKLLFSVIASVCLTLSVPAYGSGDQPCETFLRVNSYVGELMAVIYYGPSWENVKGQMAQLRGKYADALATLKNLAAKEKGQAAEIQESLTKFESNLEACSRCESQYSQLEIDLLAYLECKRHSCDPITLERYKIVDQARKCKKRD
jgi:hypothetical protein